MTEKEPSSRQEASPRKAKELWNQLSAVLESTACQFDIIRPVLLEADYIEFLSDCDCAPNGEEWLDRKEPELRIRRKGVWYYG